jgi:hypothetical protein
MLDEGGEELGLCLCFGFLFGLDCDFAILGIYLYRIPCWKLMQYFVTLEIS